MAGVNYISGVPVGDVYYSGAQYSGTAVLVVDATADATHVYLTAIIPGAAGNSIRTTETSNNMSFGAATLTGGAAAIPSE